MLRRICFFLLYLFIIILSVFFFLIDFWSVRSSINKRNKKFKIEGHKVQTPDTVARLDIYIYVF